MQTTRGTSLSDEGDKRGTSAEPSATNQHSDETVVGTAEPHRRRHIGILAGVAAFVITVDVISKIMVVAKLSDREPVRLLGGLVTLEETRNPGAAFSVGTGATVLFGLVAIAVIAVILRTARRLFSRPWSIVLGLLLGGATGNLIDRVLRAPGVLRGHVVDWIQVPHFAVFNLADSAITIGGVLAVLLAVTGRQLDGSIVHSSRSGRQGMGTNGGPTDSDPDEQRS